MVGAVYWGTRRVKVNVRKFLRGISFERLQRILTSLKLDDVPPETRGAHQLAETAILAYLQTDRHVPADVLTLNSISREDIISYFVAQYKKENLHMARLAKWTDKKLQDTVLKLWSEVQDVHIAKSLPRCNVVPIC